MNGHIIEGTPIAVDFWKVRECPNVKLFFLSHVHDDHIKGLTPSWRLPLYTSPVSAKLLAHIVKVPDHLVKELEVGTSHLIPLGETGEECMTVTLIDARHCPGSVMFLFEGYFGTFLYTGDFRYDSAMIEDPVFATFPTVDRLYLDNTYCSPSHTHPTRELVTSKILETIQAHPPNTRVFFGLTRVGKEDLMVNIAKALKEWILVDLETYEKMKILEMSDVFTVDRVSTRIRIFPFHVLNRSNFQCKDSGDDPFIIILPSSILGSDFRPPYGPKKNIYAMPYSNHCSFPEMAAFVLKIKPRQIIPIVTSTEALAAVSTFDNLLDPTPCKTFKTPSCVENWHITKGVKKLKRKRAGVPNMTKGVSFIDEDSSESKSNEKDGDKLQKVIDDPKSQPSEPSKRASKASVSDSDCDSDSGIFAVLKKMKPESAGDTVDFTDDKKSSSPLPSVEDVAKTEASSNDKTVYEVIEIDDTTAESSEESTDPQALPGSSQVPASKTVHCQEDGEKSSKVVIEVSFTLTDSGDEILGSTKDLSVTSSKVTGSRGTATDEASQERETYLTPEAAVSQMAVADATGLAISEASLVQATGQEKLVSSQTSNNGISASLFEDSLDSDKKTSKKYLMDTDLDQHTSQSGGIAAEQKSSSSENPGPLAEDMTVPGEDTDGERNNIDVEGETGDNTNISEVTDSVPVDAQSGAPAVNGARRKDPCLCFAKWRFEEALQQFLGYLTEEPFKPFVYPEHHICLL